MSNSISDFAVGDRVRVTTKDCDEGIYFGKVGTVTDINESELSIWPIGVELEYTPSGREGTMDTLWTPDELERI